ncbi:MAG TPA: hypothetical protein VF204_09995 [Streptosporangiaceae bacterium]
MNEMDELTGMRASVPAPPPGGRAQTALLEAIRAEQAGIPAPARRPGYGHGRATPRRWAMLAGTAGIAACAALAVAALLPGGTGNDAGTVRLAAWTVQRDPGGTIKITISELRDAAGLQATLRADGVPANVVFSQNPFTPTTSSSAIPQSCAAPQMSDEASARLEEKIIDLGDASAISSAVLSNGAVLVIHPSAIPAGIGVFIKAFAASPGTQNGPTFDMQTGLVMTSPQCTGS